MPASLACSPSLPSESGPELGLSLVGRAAAGCGHLECAAAAAAHERLEPLVAAAGSARRLQALSYLGWPVPELAARLGAEPLDVCALLVADTAGVRRGLAAAVAALYDALWDQPGPSRLVAGDARRRGWCPPLAWDDHEGEPHWIDDPDAGPSPLWRPSRRPHLAAAGGAR